MEGSHLMSAELSAPKPSTVMFGSLGVQIRTLEEGYAFAKCVEASGFAPPSLKTQSAIFIAIQFGQEIGLTPMQSLQSLAIINGRPSIFGDAALALVRSKGDLLESYSQQWSGDGDALKATVRVKRRSEDEIVSEFSVQDAKTANLWSKDGPWKQYPKRMLMWRARGFALRDAFGDVLKGLATVEENQDFIDITPAPIAKTPIFKTKKKEALPVSPKPEDSASSATALTTEPGTGGASEALPPDKSAPQTEPTPASAQLEAMLQSLMDKDEVSVEELGRTLKSFAVQIPRKFTGPSDLTDVVLADTIKVWAQYLDVIKAERS